MRSLTDSIIGQLADLEEVVCHGGQYVHVEWFLPSAPSMSRLNEKSEDRLSNAKAMVRPEPAPPLMGGGTPVSMLITSRNSMSNISLACSIWKSYRFAGFAAN